MAPVASLTGGRVQHDGGPAGPLVQAPAGSGTLLGGTSAPGGTCVA